MFRLNGFLKLKEIDEYIASGSSSLAVNVDSYAKMRMSYGAARPNDEAKKDSKAKSHIKAQLERRPHD